MEVLKHQYIDVHYDKHEKEEAIKYGKYLNKLGYFLEHEDSGGLNDFCDQYLRSPKILNKLNR
jgi:hypothetical protein